MEQGFGKINTAATPTPIALDLLQCFDLATNEIPTALF